MRHTLNSVVVQVFDQTLVRGISHLLVHVVQLLLLTCCKSAIINIERHLCFLKVIVANLVIVANKIIS